MTSIGNLATEDTGRIYESENYYTDFTTSFEMRGEYFEFHIDAVDFSILQDKPYTILTNIIFVANEKATKRYIKQRAAGMEWLMPHMILMLCAEDKNISGSNAHLIHGEQLTTNIEIADLRQGLSFKGFVTIKQLGLTDGKDKVYYFGSPI